MSSLRLVGMLVLGGYSPSLMAQSPAVSGSVQSAFVSGRFGGDYRTQDRFTRAQFQIEQGAWQATASMWNYSFCDWHELDDTSLAYRWGARQIKVGRFLNPVGMSTWDDQWYSTFVFLPNIELNNYNGRKLFERTITGVVMDSTVGANSFKFSASSGDFQQGQPLPDKLNRLSARWTYFNKGTVLGVALMTDTDNWGGDEQVSTFDVRHTVPHWMFRGQFVSFQGTSGRSNGFFTEVTHRHEGWEDLTLGLRYEAVLGFAGTTNWILGTTASAKIELPFDTTFLVNYTFGPDINRQPLGGGFAFGLSKTFRF